MAHEVAFPTVTILMIAFLIISLIASSILSALLISFSGFSLIRCRFFFTALPTEPFPPNIQYITQERSKEDLIVVPAPQQSNQTRRRSIDRLSSLHDLEQTPRARLFDQRVREFIGNGESCGVNFFMTWIAPASQFGDREFFSVDSLFKSNPDGCLVILSKTIDSEEGKEILKPLVDRGYRVVAVTPDLPFLLQGTPAEVWLEELKKGNVDPGTIPLAQNLSNLMRLACLYRYGGVYLDTDVIVLKGFKGLRNMIGAQSMDNKSGRWSRLNNAVLVFDKGHPLVFKFIEEFAKTFNGSKWGHNGPYLVSRVVERGGELNVTVVPPAAFYPVDWIRIGTYFKGPGDVVDERWVEEKVNELREEAYALHLWNKKSRNLTIGGGSVIGKLVSEFCVICRDM